MAEIERQIAAWLQAGDAVVVATVVRTWGSSPRNTGAKMAIRGDGTFQGSVSGGCVEGAVIETALQVHKDGTPRLLHFGVADETAWEVGLACGGEIDVFIQLVDSPAWFGAYQDDTFAAVLIVIDGPADLVGEQIGVLREGGELSEDRIPFGSEEAESVAQSIREGRSKVVQIDLLEGEEIAVFVDVIYQAPTLLMVGGAHISIALAKIAKHLGYRTALIDPRRAFASEERFPDLDICMNDWPGEALKEFPITQDTAVAVLTHDPKIDDPALLVALKSPAFYIGALGSQATQEARRERLRKEGLSDEQLSRLRGPIGLDIGARNPEEIALSIMTEIVAARRGLRGVSIEL